MSKPRCCAEGCKKLLSLTDMSCRCGLRFCGIHIHAEEHNCSYDYKADMRRYLSTSMVHLPHKKIETC